ncbi:hypothetical protein ATY75_32495 [Rhizobium sp. N122]|nr:hypothetical protein ATY75_32495 [Rhizobium sp. N122]
MASGKPGAVQRISKERVERLAKVIEEFVPNWSLGPVVRALQTLRGVGRAGRQWPAADAISRRRRA